MTPQQLDSLVLAAHNVALALGGIATSLSWIFTVLLAMLMFKSFGGRHR